MNQRWKRSPSMPGLLLLLGFLLSGPSASQDGADTDDHWLAAACPITAGANLAKIRETPFGPAVEFRSARTGRIVLHCNVEPDTFSTTLGLWAQDESPAGLVRATLFQQEVQDFDLGLVDQLQPPQALVSVESTDGTGVRAFQEDFSPNAVTEERFLYFLRIELERSSTDALVRAYNVSQMVLF